MSNRFAWAWKIASLGVPVVLVYLGFLNADEMTDRGQPLATHESWVKAVHEHSQGIVPAAAWDAPINVNGVLLQCCIRSTRLDLPQIGIVRSSV